MADDSGLSIKVLDDLPGIFSARWANDNYLSVFDDIKKKIQEKGKDIEGQSAFFNCTLAFLKSSKDVYIFEGILKGTLTYPPRGTNGFGYDPIFVPNGSNRTLAELKKKEKNKISHRKIAIDKFLESFI